MSGVSERIQELRLSLGMSREKFAQVIDLSVNTLRAIEMKGGSPRSDVLEKIAFEFPHLSGWLLLGDVVDRNQQCSLSKFNERRENERNDVPILPISKKIREIQRVEKLTRTELSELTCVNTNTLKSIKYDENKPRWDVIKKLCEAFPYYAYWLMTDKVDSPNHICPSMEKEAGIQRAKHLLERNGYTFLQD